MAFEETKDLLAACEKAKIPVPMLFLNLVTPASPCPLCVALRERESVVLGQFRETFPLLPQVLVYRCGEPHGLESLRALGRELYKPSAAAGLMIRQAQEIERMANELGLKQDDLNLDLGPLGKLL
jgi:Gas vesicle protein K